VHFSALTAPEQRVFGCLIEKRFTTPDQYPLSLNALRLAANQATNRDPVVDYDELTINEAAQRLSRYGLVRLASGHSSRAVKYRHLAEEALGVDAHQLSVLCVLLLRGSQTPGELKGRTERLAGRGYVSAMARRPGQKEQRWAQLLGGNLPAEDPATEPLDPESAAPRAPSVGVVPQTSPTAIDPSDLAARVAKLEAEVAELRELLS
jgi:uncharacterized protein YceH (UPF0502 family)